MDEIIRNILSGFPTFAGLVLLAFVLFRQNEKLLDVLISEVREFRKEITELKEAIKRINLPM